MRGGVQRRGEGGVKRHGSLGSSARVRDAGREELAVASVGGDEDDEYELEDERPVRSRVGDICQREQERERRREKHTHTQRERKREGQRDRETETDRQRERETEKEGKPEKPEESR